MIKFETKTFHTSDGATHDSVRRDIVTILKSVYADVVSAASQEVIAYFEANGVGDTEPYDLYFNYRCVSGMKREDAGIITQHGIINSLHPYNNHPHQPHDMVVPCVPLFMDGRRGFANDFYFETEVSDADGERLGSWWWVLNSKRARKLHDLYEKLDDPLAKIPKRFTV
jgi:hypothetical protein